MWGPLMWVSVYKWTGMLFRGQLYFSSAAGNLQMQRADLSDTWIFDCGWLVPLTPELFKDQLYTVVREGKSRIYVSVLVRANHYPLV